MTVSITCQHDWVWGGPDIWSNVFLGVSGKDPTAWPLPQWQLGQPPGQLT